MTNGPDAGGPGAQPPVGLPPAAQAPRAPAAAPPGKQTTYKRNKCLIIPFPKVIFFYPTALAAFICAAFAYDFGRDVVPDVLRTYEAHRRAQVQAGKHENLPTPGKDEKLSRKERKEIKNKWLAEAKASQAIDRAEAKKWLGWLFMIVFTINVLVISFDFPGVKAMAVAFAGIAAVSLAAYINVQYEFLPFVARYLSDIRLFASEQFYLFIGAVLGSIIFISWFVNRFWNKWILEPNRLVHKHGMLGDVREYPTIQMQVRKEISDIFEWCLLMSGTLVLTFPGQEPIRLENIPFINRKERIIREIIGAFAFAGPGRL